MSSLFQDIFQELALSSLMDALAKISSVESSGQRQTVAEGVGTQNQTSDAHRPFSEIIREASQKYGVDEGVISAVIQQESSFNSKAVSSCGAEGLMQLMPSTAKSLGVDNAFDPEENIMAGTRYLKEKIDEFQGSLPLALAAYNAGSGAVRKYGGIPPYKETQAYVKKILNSVDRLA